MPPVPFILAMIPLYISVVAFPNILGDIIANTVLPIANRKAIIINILYSDIIFKNFFNVPLKSFALSTAPGPPPILFLKALYDFHFPLFLLHLKQ